MPQLNTDNLEHADVTINNEPDDDYAQIEYHTRSYGAFITVWGWVLNYQYIHSEDGVVSDGELSLSEDAMKFHEETQSHIFSFNLALNIILEVERDSEQWFVWKA